MSYRSWRIPAIALTLALVLGACGGDDTEDAADTKKQGGCGDISLAFFGALTGENAALGININNGVQLALDEHNAENKDCQVGVEEFDSAGSPDQAPALAQQAAENSKIVGVVGPAFSGESRAANPILDEAGLPLVTPSATGVDLSAQNWKVFHRAVGNDNAQGPAAAEYITTELKAKKVAVIDDKSEYGKGVADIVRTELGAKVAVSDSFDDKATEFSSTVNKVKAANVDAVFFGGYYSQAGTLAKQLKDGGVTVKFVAPDGSLDPKFIEGAGAAGEGAILTAPSAPSGDIEGGEEFVANYKKKFNVDPGLYSVEGYDSANIFLEAIKAGNTTREDINKYLTDELKFKGLSKTYDFDEKGELAGKVTIFAYTVKAGKIEPIGPIGG